MPFYWTEYSIVYLDLLIVLLAVVWLFWNPSYDTELNRLLKAVFYATVLHIAGKIFMMGSVWPSKLHTLAICLLAIGNIGLFGGALLFSAYFPTLPKSSLKTYFYLKRGVIFLFVSHALFIAWELIRHGSYMNPWPVTNGLMILIVVASVPVGLWHISIVQKSKNAKWFQLFLSLDAFKDMRIFAISIAFPICVMVFYSTYVGTVAWPVQMGFYMVFAVVIMIGVFIVHSNVPTNVFRTLDFLPKLILTFLCGLLVIIAATAIGFGYQLRELYQSGILFSELGPPGHYSEPYRLYLHQHIWPLAVITVVANVGVALGTRLFMTSVLLRPLNELLAAVTEVKSGNLAVSLKSTSPDEFGVLSTSFNEMVDALGAAQSEIQQANATLENRVDQRTQELALAKDSAEKANQAKTLFLAKMGHEFRTPLNAIMGFSQLIEKGGSNRAHADTIHRNGQHLLNLFNNILDAAQGEAQQIKLQPEAFDLPSTLAHLVQTVSLKANQKGLVLNYLPKDLPAIIVADAHRLQQILINLLTNAIKFTDAGSITLTVETVSQSKDKAVISFSVEDSGIGIAPEDLSSIFAPFRQSAQQAGSFQKGSGLGLAISQQLVSLMDSKLHVTSMLGQGSSFFFSAEFDAFEQLLPVRKPRFVSPQPLGITSKAPSALLILPPNDVLDNIRAAARIGDVIEIEKQIFALSAQEQYQPFVQRIESIIETYQMQNLRDWLAGLGSQPSIGGSAESHIRA